MKLEPGKRYVTREGEVTGPLYKNDSEGWPFVGRVDGFNLSWRESGRYIRGRESAQDLVSEYTEPNKEEKPMFKVGDKVYETGHRRDESTILCIHGMEVWVVGRKRTRLTSLDQLTLVPEPKYIRKSVPELMAEGWAFNSIGEFCKLDSEDDIHWEHLWYLGTDRTTYRILTFDEYPHLWKEVK